MRTSWLLLLPLLGGCAVVSDVSGLAVGGATGAATGNPAVAYVVGIGVRAGVEELRRYVVRSRHRGEQDALAEAAGDQPLDQVRPWEIRHTIPIGNTKGLLMPIREIQTPIATCREVLFTADDDGVFTTAVCHGDSGWKWASAEPNVDRWGYLQ